MINKLLSHFVLVGFISRRWVGSGEQLDDLSGSARPLLDVFVLWRLSRLFNQGQGLLDGDVFRTSTKALQVLEQYGELLIGNLEAASRFYRIV